MTKEESLYIINVILAYIQGADIYFNNNKIVDPSWDFDNDPYVYTYKFTNSKELK